MFFIWSLNQIILPAEKITENANFVIVVVSC